MLCGQCLPFVDSCVDLGINVDSKLSFVQNISNVVSKAKASCFLILKCFLTNDVNTLVKVYTAYLRPLLEYNCAIWSPCVKKDINLVELVQRYFTRKVNSKLMLPDTCYHNRLLNLRLQRLETRRIICDVVETFKLCKGFFSLKCLHYVSLATFKSNEVTHVNYLCIVCIVVFMVTFYLLVLLKFGMYCHHVTLMLILCHVLNLN